MPSPIPDDGTSRRILDDLRLAYPHLTDAQIAHWAGVEKSNVPRWRAGERSMPVWVLARLIRKLDDATPLLGELASIAGFVVVKAPEGEAGGRDLLRVAAAVTRATGQLADSVATATDPKSEGGAALTNGERAGILAEIDAAMQRLAQLRADVEAKPRMVG
jgi:hypothetical protein